MNAVDYYNKYTREELKQLMESIRADPANRNPDKNSVWIYTRKVHKKLDDIVRAIQWHVEEERRQA